MYQVLEFNSLELGTCMQCGTSTVLNFGKLWQTLANSGKPRQTIAETASLLKFAIVCHRPVRHPHVQLPAGPGSLDVLPLCVCTFVHRD